MFTAADVYHRYFTNRPDWYDHAACRNHPTPDLWFPTRGGRDVGREAKRICNTECPVRAECLQYATTNHEYIGIWGGLLEVERRRIRRHHLKVVGG